MLYLLTIEPRPEALPSQSDFSLNTRELKLSDQKTFYWTRIPRMVCDGCTSMQCNIPRSLWVRVLKWYGQNFMYYGCTMPIMSCKFTLSTVQSELQSSLLLLKKLLGQQSLLNISTLSTLRILFVYCQDKRQQCYQQKRLTS